MSDAWKGDGNEEWRGDDIPEEMREFMKENASSMSERDWQLEYCKQRIRGDIGKRVEEFDLTYVELFAILGHVVEAWAKHAIAEGRKL